jgi:hypothetical protein
MPHTPLISSFLIPMSTYMQITWEQMHVNWSCRIDMGPTDDTASVLLFIQHLFTYRQNTDDLKDKYGKEVK